MFPFFFNPFGFGHHIKSNPHPTIKPIFPINFFLNRKLIGNESQKALCLSTLDWRKFHAAITFHLPIYDRPSLATPPIPNHTLPSHTLSDNSDNANNNASDNTFKMRC